MYKIDRERTDIEMIDSLEDIIEIVLRGYNEPIRADFSKKSRSEQIGFDVTNYLRSHNMIQIGKAESLRRLEL